MTETLLQAAAILAVLLFIAGAAGIVRPSQGIKRFRYVAGAGLFFTVYWILLIGSGKIDAFNITGGQYNWTGKILAVLLALLVMALHRPAGQGGGYGLRFSMAPGSVKPAAAVTGVYVLGGLLSMALFFSPTAFSAEALVFQATVPGIEEEIVFRGVLLALLNGAYGGRKNMNFLGAQFGWGLILVSVMFGLCHSLNIDMGRGIQFNPMVFGMTGFGGFVFGWLRERTGSVWPGVICHNLSNTLNNLLLMIM